MVDSFAGIDIGKTGAIGIVSNEGAVLDVFDMPFVGKDLDIPAIAEALAQHSVGFVMVEHQQVFPMQGAVSGFTLGEQYGMIRGYLLGAKIPFETVRPDRWKVGVSIPVKADKKYSKMVAARLWPYANLGTRADQGRSDALLIAEYGRRIRVSVLRASVLPNSV